MSRRIRRTRGFTLVEVLITITIISLLTGMFLAALGASQEQARESRTKSMISRLDAAIQTRWESYRTRRVSYNLRDSSDPSVVNGSIAAFVNSRFGYSWGAMNPGQIPSSQQNLLRLEVLRNTQRVELPQRWDDIAVGTWPTATAPFLYLGEPVNGLSQNYLRRYNACPTEPTPQYQGAECLYLIITCGGQEEDASPLDQFRGMDVGDLDRDGMNEFHDGWGNPISFIRWPTLFPSDLQPDVVPVEAAGATAVYDFCLDRHDPFDPSKSDMPASGAPRARGYRLTPLIVSPGPDGELAIMRGAAGNDPYFRPTTPGELPGGQPLSLSTDPPSEYSWLDNLHNHQLGQHTR